MTCLRTYLSGTCRWIGCGSRQSVFRSFRTEQYSFPKSRRSGDRNGGPLAPRLGLGWIWDRPWPGIGRCGDSGTLLWLWLWLWLRLSLLRLPIRLWLSGLRLRLRTELRLRLRTELRLRLCTELCLLRRMAWWVGRMVSRVVSHPHY